jgi:hypothetical protein
VFVLRNFGVSAHVVGSAQVLSGVERPRSCTERGQRGSQTDGDPVQDRGPATVTGLMAGRLRNLGSFSGQGYLLSSPQRPERLWSH